MRFLKQLYMKGHGFVRSTNKYLQMNAWHRKDNLISTDPKDMCVEPILFSLSWKEIFKRYGRR